MYEQSHMSNPAAIKLTWSLVSDDRNRLYVFKQFPLDMRLPMTDLESKLVR